MLQKECDLSLTQGEIKLIDSWRDFWVEDKEGFQPFVNDKKWTVSFLKKKKEIG